MFFTEVLVLSLNILLIKLSFIFSLELPTLIKQLSEVIPIPFKWYGFSNPLAIVIFKFFLFSSSRISKSNNPKTDGSMFEMILSLIFLYNKSKLLFNPIILPLSFTPK